MDELSVSKARVEVTVEDDKTIVRVSVPKNVINDSDIPFIYSYLVRRYDVIFFKSFYGAVTSDRSITFHLDDSFFDVKRFSQFLFSL